MDYLKYKTRENISPQGKPRVYFCCHPEDFHSCFASISDDILAIQSCAVWYADGPIVRDANFFTDLQDMQLFVMPVTRKLLTTDNETLKTDFAFAMEHHIPVLPLMQEQGLDGLFNEKCGDLQYLDKFSTDGTALRFEDKLEKYLRSVLIGDELAEKIRSAFDAYMFLSYRKKDRSHAQELMRAIHKNTFCQDIAIWYDEFLLPGEDFNASILDALRKSGLFLLAVTPNLVNEKNYVMTKEYPEARNAGKPILAAELVPTDPKQLADHFDGIPQTVDAHDEIALTEKLLESIQQMAIRENDKSPEHNFCIGLAYLNGVDVEVDHQRALALITSAAEAGHIAALEQLVAMYDLGIGVERSFDKKITYQKKLTDILEEAHRSIGTTESFLNLRAALSELGRFYYDEHDNDAARQVWDRLERLSGQSNDLLQVCSRITAKLHHAEAVAAAGGGEDSLPLFLAVYNQCRELLQNLDSDEGIPAELVCHLFSSGSHIVSEYMLRQDLDNAVAIADHLDLCICKMEADRFGFHSKSMLTAYSITFLTNAKLFGKIDAHDLAPEGFEKAIHYIREAADMSGTTDDLHNVAIAHKEYGLYLQSVGNRIKAKEQFLKALDLCEQLRDRQGNYYQKKDIAYLNSLLFQVSAPIGADMDKYILAAYESAKSLCLEYSHEPSAVFSYIQILKDRLTYMLFRKGAVDNELIGEAYALVNAIATARTANLGFLFDALCEVGNTAAGKGIDTQCFPYCLELAKALVALDNNPHHRTALKYACMNQGKYLMQRRDLSNALDCFEQASGLAMELYGVTKDPRHLFDAALCFITVMPFLDAAMKAQLHRDTLSIIAFLESASPQTRAMADQLKQLMNPTQDRRF